MHKDLDIDDLRANRSVVGKSMENRTAEDENRWMKAATLPYYRCISCDHEAMTYDSDTRVAREFIRESLRCQNCSAVYQIVDGIPRFVSGDNYAQSFGFQWNTHEKTQLDSYTGRPISEKRLFDVTGWPTDMSGQVVLEAGSGAGRFTECLLKTGATVYSFDYSTAVEANARNNGSCERLFLFQADMRSIPLQRAAFDKVMCLGVLQHTPAPNECFRCLAEMVRPGGELVVDVYGKSAAALLQWKYILRPITTRIDQRRLYEVVSNVVPLLLPAAKNMRRVGGRAGARLIPIVEYSHLGLAPEVNEQWAILDTFDMYASAHDHPQTQETLKQWFKETGFMDVSVRPGPNGLVGRGRRPE
jgi:2-polyprenyl-3-methyl-5-hydroxy-6-metoxy-1,4-benzoquinol methylase